MSFISDLQAIGKVLQKAGNIELYEKLLSIQEKAVEIMEENQKLLEEKLKLENKLKIKGSLNFETNMYYEVDKKGKRKDGPFCSRCWDHDDKLIRMHQSKKNGSSWCPECKTYGGPK